MLNLEPLIARLVEDVLRCIGEATLAELEAVTATRLAAPKPARATRRSPRRSARRNPPRAIRPAATPPPSGDVLEPPGFDAITRPEDLLVATAPTAAAASVVPPAVVPAATAPAATANANETAYDDGSPDAEEGGPPSSVQPARPSTPTLRDGESVVRATAAGVVIRRARSR
jgi:hypothetical protein